MMMPLISFSLPPGTMLGNYKLLKAQGQGGFGITYIAWDTQLKRNIALKECFPLGLCVRNPETGEIEPLPHIDRQLYRAALDSLMREAQTLASLNHERIVRVYDVFESHGSVIYVMPWLEGGSLKERMEEAAAGGNPVAPEQAREWLLQLLDGLEYLHGSGIYHRDIKPGNILFDERGAPVLIDFGAALNKPNATQTISQGEFSYAYAAPEQVTGKGEIGPWTDFYSLAATWYALISGKEVEQSLQRLMQDDLMPLAALKPAPCADRELVASIDKNLRLPAEKRCQTAAEWRAMLCLSSRGGSLGSKVVVGMMGVLLVALVVWATLMWPEKERPRQKETASLPTPPTKVTPPKADVLPKEDKQQAPPPITKKSPIIDEAPAPTLDEDSLFDLHRIELTDRIDTPPPLSAEAEAMRGAVSDYFQWTGRKEIALEKMSKIWETLKEFELWLRGRMIEEEKAVAAIGDPIKYLIIDAKEDRWSDEKLCKIWKKNPLYIASEKELQELDSLLGEMSAVLYDKDWSESYPTQTEEQRKLVKDIWIYEKRQLYILNGRLQKLKLLALGCMLEAAKRISNYGFDMCRHYFAKTPVTEEWQIREKYGIDECLAELNKRKQTCMKEIRAFIDKCRAYYAKVDRVLQGKNSIPELKEWKESVEYELLKKEGMALRWDEREAINGGFADGDLLIKLNVFDKCESILAPQKERPTLYRLMLECNSARFPIKLYRVEGWEETGRCHFYLERAYQKRMEELR